MPDAKATEDRLKISCGSCKQRMDVTHFEPFTKIKCINCGSSLIVPKRLQQFALLGRIGKGGMGSVFRALDTSLNRQVAIKLMSQELAEDPTFVESFSHQARAAAALNHHNIAQIYSFGHDQGQYFLAMELLDRGNLEELIGKDEKLTEAQVIEIGLQVTLALKAAAAQGLVHQDIKPANILFNEEGNAKIVDFGLAQFSEAGKTAAGLPLKGIWGTAEYIAPEKLENQKHDFRSDMYSLGVTLYQALSGRLPFEGETSEKIAYQRLKVIPPSVQKYRPDVSDRTAAILAKMMSRHPAERFSNYDELLTALTTAKRTVAHHLNRVASVKQGVAGRPVARLRNRILPIVIILLLGLGVLWVYRNQNRVTQILGMRSLPASSRSPSDEPVSQSSNVLAKNAPPTASINLPEAIANRGWQSRLDVVVGHLADGNYSQAQYDCNALIELPNGFGGSKAKKNMTYCLQGLAQWLQGQAADEKNPFLTLVENATDVIVPVEKQQERLPVVIAQMIQQERLPVVIAQMMTGKISQEKLVASLDSLSLGGRALARFSLGVKNLCGLESEQEHGIRWLRDFLAAPPIQEEDWRWVERLRPVAVRLQKEYGILVTAMDESRQLRDKRKWQEALDRLSPSQIQPPLTTASFLSRADQQRANVQNEWDTFKAVQITEQAAQMEKENQLFSQAEAEANRLNLQAPYSFAQVVETYKHVAPQITSSEIQATIQKKVERYHVLADLKTQLMADVAQKPLPANQITLNSHLVPDTLVRCSETSVIFQNQYGESTVYWRTVPPTEFAKIVRFYFSTLGANSDKPAQESAAKRYLALAIFYSELKIDASESYNLAVAAATLYPPYKETVRRFFPNIE